MELNQHGKYTFLYENEVQVLLCIRESDQELRHGLLVTGCRALF
jgi:hypothetical protein